MTKKNEGSIQYCTFIIVNYNTAGLTSDCIESVEQHYSSDRYKIIVMDNASADGSFNILKEKHPSCEIIPLEKN